MCVVWEWWGWGSRRSHHRGWESPICTGLPRHSHGGWTSHRRCIRRRANAHLSSRPPRYPPPLVRRHPSSRAHTLFRADCDGLGRAGGEGSNGAVHNLLSGGEAEGDTEGLLDRGRTMSSSGLSSSGLDSVRRAAIADAVLVDFDGRPEGISNR